ncbi:MAG: flagellar biosynthesis protein FlhB [bacterium]
MADTESGQEKTEPATGRKRTRAREEGNVPKSHEVNTTLVLIAGVASFYYLAGHYFGGLMEAVRYYLQESARPVTPDSYYSILLEAGLRTLIIVFPFLLILTVAALAINLLQVGFLLSGKPLIPRFGRMNPAQGIKRLFSARGAVELVKSMGKIFIIAPVMIYTVYKEIPNLMGLVEMEVRDSMIYMGYACFDLAVKALLIMIVLAIADYAYQRWQHEKDLRMTKEEVRQEMKDIQGDPKIKSRIRSIQIQMARQRMMEQVPQAEVVVTNPTEYAVALKYTPDEHPAPQVIAKGRNLLAQRIKEIALEHNIPIVENRPLAQSLYKLVGVGGLIPPDLYQAVAEVLAYVYKLTRRIPVRT